MWSPFTMWDYSHTFLFLNFQFPYLPPPTKVSQPNASSCFLVNIPNLTFSYSLPFPFYSVLNLTTSVGRFHAPTIPEKCKQNDYRDNLNSMQRKIWHTGISSAVRLRGLMSSAAVADSILDVSPVATTRLSRQAHAFEVSCDSTSLLLECAWPYCTGAAALVAMSSKRSNILSGNKTDN